MKELQEKGPLHVFSAVLSAIGYLLHAFVVTLRLSQRGSRINLVHAHYIFPQGLFGLILARFCRVPFVVSAVGSDVNVMIRENTVFRAICLFVAHRADVTIAVSGPLRRALEWFGVGKSVYLPNSVDTASILPKDESLDSGSILFVGAMTHYKRPLVLLSAFERVVATVPGATLTMCGDGPLRKAVEEEIQRKRLDGKVTLLGQASSDLVIECLSKSAIFVLPSQFEGLSFALLEAMAAGKVIVATCNESHSAIFRNGQDALLFDLDNEKQLAEQMVLALTDSQLRSRLSRSARELCLRNFSNMKIGPKLERIYLDTI